MNNQPQLPEDARFVDGVLHQVLRRTGTGDRRPALFLDRDGCVNVEVGYLHEVEKVRLIAGAADVIGRANGLGVAVVLVTNQSGIGRGYFGWPEFFRVQEKILSELAGDGALVDAVYACPHHGEAPPPYDHPGHPSRKPGPGMLIAAAADLNLDLNRSWIVGDRAADLEAGLNGGLAGGVHVATGHGLDAGERERSLALNSADFTASAAASIAQVPELVGWFSQKPRSGYREP